MNRYASAPCPRRSRGVVIVVLALALLAPATAATAATAGPPEERERVVVTFAPDTPTDERTATFADAGVTSRGDVRAFDAQSADSVPFAVAEVTPVERAELAADPAVAHVETDVPTRAAAVSPADPWWPSQDGVRAIRADEAWERTTGDDDIVIAVVDTGVDSDNADLGGKLVPGYDLVNDDADPEDDNGHGTAAATVAAARTSNTVGIAGVCWRCRIMPLKALDADGTGFLSDAARAVLWAVERDADVINMSLGAPSDLQAMRNALAAADQAGVIVVASAGNSGSTSEQYPAADPRALSVAALNGTTRAPYSNHGSWVDIAAPGCNPAVNRSDEVVNFCGTSSSAPLVSGVAGLALSTRGDATDEDVLTAIADTAQPLGSGLGDGRIVADAVVEAVATAPSDGEPDLAEPPPSPGEDPPAEVPPPEDGPGDDPDQPGGAVPEFRDIDGNFHAENIRRIAEEGVTGGCDAGRYCPARNVTRGQIATFLDRALDLPSGDASFDDVPAGHTHAEGIAAVAAAGITVGCAPDRFCPNASLSRAQMASLLARALDLPDGVDDFADVTGDDTHAGAIAAVADAGITQGCEPGRFCPDASVTRAQMATFLVRSFDL